MSVTEDMLGSSSRQMALGLRSPGVSRTPIGELEKLYVATRIACERSDGGDLGEPWVGVEKNRPAMSPVFISPCESEREIFLLTQEGAILSAPADPARSGRSNLQNLAAPADHADDLLHSF